MSIVGILSVVIAVLGGAIPALITVGITLNKISVLTERLMKLESLFEANQEKFGHRLRKLETYTEVDARVRKITRGEMPAYVPPEESGKRED